MRHKLNECAVIVFLKHPHPGQVKTRLAAEIGFERAAELYRGWIEEVFAPLQSIRDHARVIGYFSGGECAQFAPWHHLADDWLPQPTGDLGERLTAGFARAFDESHRVIAIGTDCLDVSADLLDSAFVKLENSDAIFGPARDGGYYLVGLSRPILGIFDAVRWSCAATLADHLENCRKNGWAWELLETKSDIDTWDDWLNHCKARNRPP